MKQRTNYIQDEAGLTLIELLVSAVMIGMLALLVSNFYVDRLIDYSRSFTKIILQANTKQAVETMVRDIKYAQNVETSNRWPDSHSPSAPGNLYSWQSSNTTPATLVLATPSKDSSGNILYVDALHNTTQTDDIVYFIGAGNILYRRTVANPVTGNAAKTTCPPSIATPSCPPDAKVVEDVASLGAAYFDGSNISTTPASATTVQITLQQTRSAFNRSYNSSLTSQATMRNQ